MRIVRIVLAETNNETITLAEKMLSDDDAWIQIEKLTFDLTGERRKKPLKVTPQDNTLKKA